MWKARQISILWDTKLDHIKASLGVIFVLLIGWVVQLMFPQAPLWLIWFLAFLVAVAWLAIHYRDRIANLLRNTREWRRKRAQKEGAASPIVPSESAPSPVEQSDSRWINEDGAIRLLMASSLVKLRLPNETMTVGEALFRRQGLITSPTGSWIRANEIARHLLKTYNEECSWGKRNGMYYKEYLKGWIGEKAYQDHAATSSR